MIEVYRNLRKGCWSVRENGRVVEHADVLALENATFVVRPSGNARVRKEGVKNVHAFVRGTRATSVIGNVWDRVTYNPYENTTFVTLHGTPVRKASYVKFTPHGCYFK